MHWTIYHNCSLLHSTQCSCQGRTGENGKSFCSSLVTLWLKGRMGTPGVELCYNKVIVRVYLAKTSVLFTDAYKSFTEPHFADCILYHETIIISSLSARVQKRFQCTGEDDVHRESLRAGAQGEGTWARLMKEKAEGERNFCFPLLKRKAVETRRPGSSQRCRVAGQKAMGTSC